jgi:hypothetical protein
MFPMRTICSIGRRSILATVFALVVSSALWTTGEALPARAMVTRITGSQVGDETLITITATKPVSYQLRNIRSDWVVIDIPGTELAGRAGSVPAVRGLVKKIRVGQFMPNIVRVVVELIQPAEVHLSSSSDHSAIVVGIPLVIGKHAIVRAQEVAHQIVVAPPEAPTVSREVQTTSAQLPPSKITSGPRLAARIRDVVPGQYLGLARLGMSLQDLQAALGSSGSAHQMGDGSVVYRWYQPPNNIGLGARVGADNTVFRIWILNDPNYVTKERLHAGSTEAQIRAALGEPSQTSTNAELKLKTLRYDSLGIWFSIQLDERYNFYNSVFEMGVMRPR